MRATGGQPGEQWMCGRVVVTQGTRKQKEEGTAGIESR
jgi:hypothetical protein